jgi:hypothetical protein
MNNEESLTSVWDQHLVSEFTARSADQALATMTLVPRLIGFTLLTELRGLEPDTHGKFCSPCLLGHGISSSPNV